MRDTQTKVLQWIASMYPRLGTKMLPLEVKHGKGHTDRYTHSDIMLQDNIQQG